MRLCFGTFAKVLILCARKQKVNRKLIAALTLTIDPDSRFKETGNNAVNQQVSRLLKCESNFSAGSLDGTGANNIEETGRKELTKIWEMAGKLTVDEISLKFKDVIGFISDNKKNQVIVTLLEIIKEDTTIDNENSASFEKYVGVKKDIFNQEEYILSEFLAGILLYTVRETDNRVGKDCVNSITLEYIDKIYETSHQKDRIKLLDFSLSKQSIEKLDSNTDIDDYIRPIPLDRIEDMFNEILGEREINRNHKKP